MSNVAFFLQVSYQTANDGRLYADSENWVTLCIEAQLDYRQGMVNLRDRHVDET